MTDDLHSPTTAGPEPPPAAEPPPLGSPRADGGAAPTAAFSTTERPELLVGAAFAGGFVAALILKRLGR